MSRSIPSLKTLTTMLSGVLEKSRNIPGGVHGEDAVKHNLKTLRNVLVQWRDRELKSREMLEQADKILDGHGVEYIGSSDDDMHSAHGAYYVNMGDTYTPTLLLDLDKARVYATDWGSWVEAEERAGRSFP